MSTINSLNVAIEKLIKNKISEYRSKAEAAIEYHSVEKLLAISYAFEELLDDIRKENSQKVG